MTLVNTESWSPSGKQFSCNNVGDKKSHLVGKIEGGVPTLFWPSKLYRQEEIFDVNVVNPATTYIPTGIVHYGLPGTNPVTTWLGINQHQSSNSVEWFRLYVGADMTLSPPLFLVIENWWYRSSNEGIIVKVLGAQFHTRLCFRVPKIIDSLQYICEVAGVLPPTSSISSCWQYQSRL